MTNQDLSYIIVREVFTVLGRDIRSIMQAPDGSIRFNKGRLEFDMCVRLDNMVVHTFTSAEWHTVRRAEWRRRSRRRSTCDLFELADPALIDKLAALIGGKRP